MQLCGRQRKVYRGFDLETENSISCRVKGHLFLKFLFSKPTSVHWVLTVETTALRSQFLRVEGLSTLWMAHSVTLARLDVGRSQGPPEALTGLGDDPRAPHHWWWPRWFCLEHFGAGSTRAVTVALEKPQEGAREVSKPKPHHCFPDVALRRT